MARPKRRYVRRDEIKFRERKPPDGQPVFFRMHGHKHYKVGFYSADRKMFTLGTDTSGRMTASNWPDTYVMGWLPLGGKPITSNKRG